MLNQWQSAEGMVRLVHASLERNDRVPDFFGYHTAGLLEDSHFQGQITRVTFAGHSHLGAVYERPGNELWVNAGSVGYPFIGKPDHERYVPYATYTTCLYQPATGSVQVTLRRVAYPLGDLIADYLRAGVLDSCAPFSQAVFAQTVLNRSVIFQAMRKARLLGVKPDQDDVYLQGYLVSEGLEAEMQGVLQNHLEATLQ
jgi:hypothetical protein